MDQEHFDQSYLMEPKFDEEDFKEQLDKAEREILERLSENEDLSVIYELESEAKKIAEDYFKDGGSEDDIDWLFWFLAWHLDSRLFRNKKVKELISEGEYMDLYFIAEHYWKNVHVRSRWENHRHFLSRHSRFEELNKNYRRKNHVFQRQIGKAFDWICQKIQKLRFF